MSRDCRSVCFVVEPKATYLSLCTGLRSDENAELFTATVIYDSLVPNKSNYNAAKDRLSKVMHKLSQQSS